MTRVAFHNLGCKVNAYETEAMLQQMEEAGCEIVPFNEKADIYVINTCTVTNIADRKSRQMIHRAKKNNPEALVVAVGCYVQADPEAAMREGGADLVIGNDQKGRLLELVREKQSSVVDLKKPKNYEPLSLAAEEGHTRAFLKIQDGCNQFCSYCLIPYVRGRVRSRAPEEILREAETLAGRGYREIVLTGIHLSSWAVDLSLPESGKERETPFGTALCTLAERLAGIPGIGRIRLSSLEPRIITEEFVSRMADIPEVCPHFHLSLQSGSAATLRRMNRHYTPEEYMEACRLIRRYYEHPAITTDVIVGFPGETEEEFAETCRFLDEIRFYETHIFKYSRRAGTAADRMPDQIPEPVKAERSHVLQIKNEKNRREFCRWYIGKNVDFLAEEYEGHKDGDASGGAAHPSVPEADRKDQSSVDESGARLTGFTREYVRLSVPAADHVPGDLFEVHVEEGELAD